MVFVGWRRLMGKKSYTISYDDGTPDRVLLGVTTTKGLAKEFCTVAEAYCKSRGFNIKPTVGTVTLDLAEVTSRSG